MPFDRPFETAGLAICPVALYTLYHFVHWWKNRNSYLKISMHPENKGKSWLRLYEMLAKRYYRLHQYEQNIQIQMKFTLVKSEGFLWLGCIQMPSLLTFVLKLFATCFWIMFDIILDSS